MCRALFAPLLAATVLLAWPAALRAEPFVFVSLPDTQIYAENRAAGDSRFPAATDPRGTGAIFFDQTQWIADNAEARRIRFVHHLGDIVQNGDELTEWALAKDAMDILRNADIPHGTVMGNHDDNHGPDYRRNYLDHFGPQEFVGRSWYMGSSPAGAASWQQVVHEGVKFGFLNFSIDQPQAEIDWAHGVVEANPDVIFIVGTHRYMADYKLAVGRYGEEVASLLGDIRISEGFANDVIEPNSAQEFYEEFVNRHPNIVMVHAGHFHAEALRLDGLNGAARQVIEILTDYQSTRNGGDGYLRIYEMDLDADTFRFETYSPTLDRKRTTFDHFVETIFLAWEQRENIMEVLGVDAPTYFLILDLLKNAELPDDYLLQHPDYDTEEERAYYARYLEDNFKRRPPARFRDPAEWKGFWLLAFARDADDPYDFSDGIRSPSGVVAVDYSKYFVPTPSLAPAPSLMITDKAGHPERRRLAWSARHGRMAVPKAGSEDDPLVSGATLELVNPTTGERVRIELPAESWQVDAKGYVYQDAAGPCSWALLGRNWASAWCHGEQLAYTLDEDAQGSVGVSLALGSGLRICTLSGGDVDRDTGTGTDPAGVGQFKARNAPAPEACAEGPAAP